MSIIGNYEEFIRRVDRLGYMLFSPVIPGFPSVWDETLPGHWHTGDPETDPWRWKDRAAEEKKLAFGCVLGGHKGFISKRMYPFFYAACNPGTEMEERWASGEINQIIWRLWQVFEQGAAPDTGEIRKLMGVTKKQGAGKIDGAIRELEKDFYITVSGNRRKLNKFGEPYGWAANTYAKVTDWAPKSWLEGSAKISRKDAARAILEAGAAASGRNVDQNKLAALLKL